MDTVYNAANAASRAIFGENANDNSQGQNQNRNPNSVTTDTSDHDRPSASETNPFRQSGVESKNKPSYSTTGSGYGSQHTATSGNDHEVLNKPHDAGVGSLEKSNTGNTHDQPSGTEFERFDTPGPYAEHSCNYGNIRGRNVDKPTTTTNIYPKNSIGDLNKDGVRHEASDLDNQRTGVHFDNPTISSVHDHTNTSSSGHDKPFTSRFSEDTNTQYTSTNIGPAGTLGGVGAPHEHYTPANKVFSQSSTTDPSSSIPRSFDDNNASGNNTGSSPYLDTTTTHIPHHQSGAPAQGTNIQSLVDPNPVTSTSDISSTSKPTSTDYPSATAGSSAHGAANSGLETANAAPKAVSGAIGSGPGAAVEPSIGAHSGHAQQQTQEQQGADRPSEEPFASTSAPSAAKKDTGTPRPLGSSTESGEESKGTGEKYEKSTGVAAEGGDFDASRPGAGKEADRLLDEKGIHHGKETRPDTSNTTAGAGHSKLLPGHKDKIHTDTSKGSHHDSKSTSSPTTDNGSSGHKGLGEKIREKLHIHH